MKHILLFGLLASFAFNSFSQSIAVNLRYVNYRIETPFSIHCEYFRTAFSKDEYKDWKPTEKQILDSISLYSENFKLDNWPNADVRASLVIVKNNKKYHYCFDQSGHFINGGKIYENEKLFNFLKKYIWL